MIFSALLSFLGGSAFRMIWGEISAWLTARQDHQFELDRMRLQAELDEKQHARNMESIRLQADLGVKEIRVKAETAIDQLEADTWGRGVLEAMKPSGIAFVDAWNQSIRPAAATIALYLWVRALYAQNWVMKGTDIDLVFAILGFFFADRSLAKRGK